MLNKDYRDILLSLDAEKAEYILSLKDLIKNKLESGRPKDLVDAEMLKSIASSTKKKNR